MKKIGKVPNAPQTTPQGTFEPILTKEEVASYLHLTPQQVYELTRRRSPHPLPFMKAGKFLRFRLSAVDGWLKESG